MPDLPRPGTTVIRPLSQPIDNNGPVDDAWPNAKRFARTVEVVGAVDVGCRHSKELVSEESAFA
jgi:hypothetical protein